MISIIGAGITGLVAAAYLKKAGHKVQLFDSRDQAGGNIRSLQSEKYLLELGPNSLVLNDRLYEFLSEWGLGDKIVEADSKAKFRFILKNGRYRKLPTGPFSLLTSATFSWKAKRQLLKERKLGPLYEEGDSIDQFFRKRLGDEWTDYVVHPFISGVFAGNPRELLIEQAFPRILALEQEHGSLLRGMMASRKTQSHRGTISLQGGLQLLPQQLSQYLKNELFLEHPLLGIRPQEDGRYQLQFKQKEVISSTVLLCLPAFQTARLLQDIDAQLSQDLQQVEYPPVSMLFSAYKRKDVKHKLNGFGALHNHLEGSFSLGSIFSSSIFPGRCPEDEVLLTTFVGGDLYPEHARLVEEEIKRRVEEELGRLLGIAGKPVFQQLQRWPRAIPQYKRSVLASQLHASTLESKRIYLGGNWIGGISVGDSIEWGRKLAEKIQSAENLKEDAD